MSLQYLLDGYNLMHQMPSLISLDKRLEDKRKALIGHIERNQLQGSPSNKVTIVFDGKFGIWGSENAGKINVVFSCDETADDKIKKIVEGASNKKNIVVVTDDRAIKYAVRPLGCRVIGTKEFLYGERPGVKKEKTQKTKRANKQYSKTISKTLEHKITSEMKKIWVDKKYK